MLYSLHFVQYDFRFLVTMLYVLLVHLITCKHVDIQGYILRNNISSDIIVKCD